MFQTNLKSFKNIRGFSLIDLVVSMSMFSIMTATAISNWYDLTNSSDNAADVTIAYLKEVRTKAIQTTLAYTIQPVTASTISIKYSPKCSSTTKITDASATPLTLPKGTQFQSTSWSICFDSRGFSSSSGTFIIGDYKGRIETIQYYLGGGMRKA
ncbi:hypothetical protein JNK13_11350 [bacterium]|nr:hypothetical protein [bacterium]